MILRKEITQQSELWGVPPDTVDKDWVLGHFVSSFYQVNEHLNTLIFKGGTCLRKCRFPDYRFSEDLDFTSLDPDYRLTRGVLKEAIEVANNNSGILFHLDELKDMIYKDELSGFQAKIRYWGANHSKNQAPPIVDRWLTSIKLEITLYERMVFGPENLPIKHPYSDINSVSKIKIPCYDLKEVIAEKIRSLVQRSYTAPRDFYDIWYLKNQFNDSEWAEIREAFLMKMKYRGYIYSGVDQLMNDKNYDILKRSWEQSLRYQLQSSSFPELDDVAEGLTALFKKHFEPNAVM